MRSDDYSTYLKTNYKGQEIVIEFNDNKLILTDKQIKDGEDYLSVMRENLAALKESVH